MRAVPRSRIVEAVIAMARALDLTAVAEGVDHAERRYDDGNCMTAAVGLRKPNAFGLADMHGNVAEWVLDQYRPDFYKASADDAARRGPFAVPKSTYPRVVRGGSWDDDPDGTRRHQLRPAAMPRRRGAQGRLAAQARPRI